MTDEVLDLVVLPTDERGMDLVFIEGKDLSSMLADIRALAEDLPSDMSKKKNRDAVAGFAYKVARAKGEVERAGKEVAARYKDIPKRIDANRRAYKEAFESLQNEVRAPLDAWERAEEEQEKAIQGRIQGLVTLADNVLNSNAKAVEDVIGLVDCFVVDDSFGKFEVEALRTKETVRAKLVGLLEVRKQEEARQAEEARLKAEREAAERKAAEERAVREAEERVRKEAAQAQAEAERRAQEAEARAAQAVREREEAEAKAKAEAERAVRDAERRRAEEEARLKAEEAARMADTAHRAEVNRAIVSALREFCDLDEGKARAVVVAIAKEHIPGLSIRY